MTIEMNPFAGIIENLLAAWNGRLNKQENTSILVTSFLKKNFITDSIDDLNTYLAKHGLQILKNEAPFMDSAMTEKKDNADLCNYSLTSK